MTNPAKGLVQPAEYEIGYGKPPKATQFKPGYSGNKKGRPKGSRNFQNDLKQVLNSKTVVTLDGKPKKITTQMAALQRLRQKALKSDARALDKLIELAKEASETEQIKTRSRNIVSEDAAILERYLAQQNDQESPA